MAGGEDEAEQAVPDARPVGNAVRRPLLEGGDEGVLGQLLGRRSVGLGRHGRRRNQPELVALMELHALPDAERALLQKRAAALKD